MTHFKEGDILHFKNHFNIRRIITAVRSTGYSYIRGADDQSINWNQLIYESENTADPFFEDGWRLFK